MKSVHIKNFDLSQVDVAHRVAKNRFSPIIIRFKTKSDRKSFVIQKKKLKSMKISDIDKLYEEEAFKPTTEQPNGWKRPYIQFQDSLTKYSGELLKEARTRFGKLNYEFPGYVVDGHVKVKKRKTDRPIRIRCMADINKLDPLPNEKLPLTPFGVFDDITSDDLLPQDVTQHGNDG